MLYLASQNGKLTLVNLKRQDKEIKVLQSQSFKTYDLCSRIFPFVTLLYFSLYT